MNEWFENFKHPQIAKIALVATIAILVMAAIVVGFDASGDEDAAPGAAFVFALCTGIGMLFFTAGGTSMAKGANNTSVFLVALAFLLFALALTLMILEYHALAANPLEDFGPAIVGSLASLFMTTLRGEMERHGE